MWTNRKAIKPRGVLRSQRMVRVEENGDTRVGLWIDGYLPPASEIYGMVERAGEDSSYLEFARQRSRGPPYALYGGYVRSRLERGLRSATSGSARAAAGDADVVVASLSRTSASFYDILHASPDICDERAAGRSGYATLVFTYSKVRAATLATLIDKTIADVEFEVKGSGEYQSLAVFENVARHCLRSVLLPYDTPHVAAETYLGRIGFICQDRPCLDDE